MPDPSQLLLDDECLNTDKNSGLIATEERYHKELDLPMSGQGYHGGSRYGKTQSGGMFQSEMKESR